VLGPEDGCISDSCSCNGKAAGSTVVTPQV
jgi:hypothetical protein